jgi:hypothetical protein
MFANGSSAQTVEETTDFMQRALTECALHHLPYDVHLTTKQSVSTVYTLKYDQTTIRGNILNFRTKRLTRYNTISADIPLNAVEIEFPYPYKDAFKFKCGVTKCITVIIHPGENLKLGGELRVDERSILVSDLEVNCKVEGFGPRLAKAHEHYLKQVPAAKKDPF